MCSSSEAGSYSRLIDFVDHSTLGLRVKEKKKKDSLSIDSYILGVGHDMGGLCYVEHSLGEAHQSETSDWEIAVFK